MEKTSCPKKIRLNEETIALLHNNSINGGKNHRDTLKERTYTKYPSEFDLYQYQQQYSGIKNYSIGISSEQQQYNRIIGNGIVEDAAICYNGALPIHSGTTTLKRSKSLAITRDDIYTDLQNGISPQQQQSIKSRRSQLIPRARLIDKGSFKERTTYQQLERSNTKRLPCGSIEHFPQLIQRLASQVPFTEQIPIPEKIDKVTTILTSWPESHDIVRSYPQLKPLSSSDQSESDDNFKQTEQRDNIPITSHNPPSEIDSLDSNCQNKSTTCSIEQNQCDDSDENRNFTTKLYENNLGLNLPNYYPDSIYDTDLSLSHVETSILDNHIQNDILCNNNPQNFTDKQLEQALLIPSTLEIQTDSSYEKETNFEEFEVSSKMDLSNSNQNIQSPNLTQQSFDVYTQELEFQENYQKDKFQPTKTETKDLASGHFIEVLLNNKSESKDRPKESDIIYSQIDFKPKVVATDLKQNLCSEPTNIEQFQLKKSPKSEDLSNSKVKSFINKNFKSVFTDTISRRKSDVNKLISTEPYVTTLLENQYYSLPDVTISKSLRKCARIDAKLRQIDEQTSKKKYLHKNCNNRFVVNIGSHMTNITNNNDVDETQQDRSIIADNIIVNRKVVSKPIEIAKKCLISTEKTDRNCGTSLDINLDTFQDEINLTSSVNTGSEKITIKILDNTTLIKENTDKDKLNEHKEVKKIEKADVEANIEVFKKNIINEDTKKQQGNKSNIKETDKDKISLNNDGIQVSDNFQVTKLVKANENSTRTESKQLETNSNNFTINKCEMSKPQILNVVNIQRSDGNKGTEPQQLTKEHNCDTPKRNIHTNNSYSTTLVTINNDSSHHPVEYEDKLNAVQCYWGKIPDKNATVVCNKNTKTDKKKHSKILQRSKSTISTTSFKKMDNTIEKKSSTASDALPVTKVVKEETCMDDSKTIIDLPAVKIEDVRKLFEPNSQKEHEIVEETLPSQVEQVRKLFESPPEPIEESKMGSFVKESCSFFEKAYGTIKKTFTHERPPIDMVESISDKKNYPNINQVEIIEKKYQNEINIQEKSEVNKIVPGDHIIICKTKSNGNDEQEFDHIRYKVMKSNIFQKNMFDEFKKEMQFDGLLQYLQDYSFQELLVNNNVVIIEPVRTKYEPEKKSISLFNKNCNISLEGKKLPDTDISIDDKIKKPSLRKRFFYHPVRVNRELIEEELPDPETVRKVRTFFEREFGASTTKLIKSQSSKNLTDDDKTKPRKRILRYLTVDTNYDKWDMGSISSGVSSSESITDFDSLKLPNSDNLYSSEDNICHDQNESCSVFDASVSQDVLKKIRECGTSITYYGGKVLDAHNGNPMTKTIMKEIEQMDEKKQQNTDCGRKNSINHKTNELKTFSQCSNNDSTNKETYQGVKFKLIKSNSCSSRLELVGANKQQNLATKQSYLPKRNSTNNSRTSENIEKLRDNPKQNTKQNTKNKQTNEKDANINNSVQLPNDKKFNLKLYEYTSNDGATKFGEMIFEEFEVAECLGAKYNT